MKPKILLLDDEESLIKWLSYALEQKGYEVSATTEPDEALRWVKETKYDCIISDVRMPGMNGFEFLRAIRKIYPSVPLIFITAYGSLESAINALRDKASDYILKPFSIDEMLMRLRANIERTLPDSSEIVGESKIIKNLLNLVRKIAPSDTTVLILGESGTGKELIAREMHRLSNRSARNFISLSCAALPETLLESELFGYKKGAFTGAVGDKEGLFRAAHGGSFFLDEIGDASLGIQMKLLRLLEEKEIVPLGSTKSIKVDVRLIAATNKDLKVEVSQNNFREDLFYRLNVIPINLPPLRDRAEDIPALAEHFMRQVRKRENIGERKLPVSVMNALKQYRWPGNVRELKHVIERAVILSESQNIKVEHLGLPMLSAQPSLDQIQNHEIQRVLTECSGNVAKAAKILGVSRATLYRKIRISKDANRRD